MERGDVPGLHPLSLAEVRLRIGEDNSASANHHHLPGVAVAQLASYKDVFVTVAVRDCPIIYCHTCTGKLGYNVQMEIYRVTKLDSKFNPANTLYYKCQQTGCVKNVYPSVLLTDFTNIRNAARANNTGEPMLTNFRGMFLPYTTVP